MAEYKKISVAACLMVSAFLGIGTTQNPEDDEKLTKKNLKVIPKSISKENLEIFMTRYTKELGVPCIYCHVLEKHGLSVDRLDFITDEKPEKKIAREMMKMTNNINKKYFDIKNNYDPLQKLPVSCKTCHRGIVRPNNKIF